MRDNILYVCNVGDSRAIVLCTPPVNGSPLPAAVVKKTGGNHDDSHRLAALPLSSDQTPYRRDEKIRVKKCGARVLTMDQIEGVKPILPEVDDSENSGKGGPTNSNGNGNSSNKDELSLGDEIDEGGDPPRVWSPYGDYPGTAFTRSFGDSIAEELGVVADPEILQR